MDCKCNKKRVSIIKDKVMQGGSNSILKNQDAGGLKEDDLKDDTVIEDGSNGGDNLEEDDLKDDNPDLSIVIKKSKNPGNSIRKNAAIDESKEIESETEAQKILRSYENIWAQGIHSGAEMLEGWIDKLLKDAKGFSDGDQKLYTSYYLSPETEAAKYKMQVMQQHYDGYIRELKAWCRTLPLKDLQSLIDKMRKGLASIESICVAVARDLDLESKQRLTNIFIEYMNQWISKLYDYMKHPDIIKKIPSGGFLKSISIHPTKGRESILYWVESYEMTEGRKLKKLQKLQKLQSLKTLDEASLSKKWVLEGIF